MMGLNVQAFDVDDALYQLSKAILKYGCDVSPRENLTKEIVAPQVEIYKPQNCIVTNPARKLSIDYLKAELIWYQSGNPNIDKIKDLASIWGQIADDKGNVNSNYGEIVFKQKLEKFYGSQFDWVIKKLNQDKDSRQALINFNQPKHKYIDNKDFVCTISTQFLIRENQLIEIVNMRSNDLIYGFCYDVPFFSYLQNRILDELDYKYEQGALIHNAGSLHVYQKHFSMLEEIVVEFEKHRCFSKQLDEI